MTADQRAALLQELCGRCLTPCTPDPAQGCVELPALTIGQRGRIVGYRGEPSEVVSRRLFDLGFASGVDVELVGRAPFRGPLMFRVAGADMLLRAREAGRIVVRLEPASAA